MNGVLEVRTYEFKLFKSKAKEITEKLGNSGFSGSDRSLHKWRKKPKGRFFIRALL